MRTRMCVSALALGFLVSLAALPAAAKSVDGMRAQVPFDFHVGDRLVRAGAYTRRALNGLGTEGTTPLPLPCGPDLEAQSPAQL